MSDYNLSKTYNPFKNEQSVGVKHHKQPSTREWHQSATEFSHRLNELLAEKSALKIDYQEIHRDLTACGFPIKATNPKDYHSGLDILRLKAGLHIMGSCFQDMNENKINNDEAKHYFQQEVSKVFEILSRDYKRLSSLFSEKLNDTEKFSLPELESQLQNHIAFYNNFTYLIEEYLNSDHINI